MKRIICFLLPLWIASSVSAQKNWTLEECIRYSLDNNLQIKRQVLNTANSEETYNQAKMEYLPSVNAGYNHSISTGRSLNTDTYSWDNNTVQNGSMGVSANYTLFKGFQNYYNLQSSHFQLMANQQLTEKLKNDISVNVAMFYLQILFDREITLVAEKQLEVSQMQAGRVEKLVEAGSKARGELLEIQAQVASDMLSLTNAKNNYNLSKLNLVQQLDLDSVSGFDIVVPSDMVFQAGAIPNLDSVYTIALASMPQIKGAEFSLKAAETGVKLARSYYSPELSMSGSYYTRYTKDALNPLDSMAFFGAPATLDYPYSDQLKDNQYRSLSLNLNIPIFNKRQIYTQVAKSRIQLEDARIQLRQEQLSLYKEIQQAHSDAVAAKAKYQAAEDAMASNEEALKYTTEKYNVGISNAMEFNEAKKNAGKAKSDYLQAKYEYLFKLKILDFYAGKPINL